MPMTIVAPTFDDDLSTVPDEEVLLHVLTGEWIPSCSHADRRQRSRASRPSTAGTVVPVIMNEAPMWEITSESGRVFYLRRAHIPGFRPIGLSAFFNLGATRVYVAPQALSDGPIYATDSFEVPESWYEEDA